MRKKPLLSICIPTFNRSKLLKASLLSVLEQIDGYEDDVEVIVSDNCSSDDTEQVIHSLQIFRPFKYNRNKENIGAGQNFYLLTNELANGEYCWLIGDDDFLRKDSLPRLIKMLKDNPNIDLFYLNCMRIDVMIVERMEPPASSAKFSDDLCADSSDRYDRELNSIDELIDPAKTASFLAAIMCSIFRRKIWLEQSLNVAVSYDNFRDVYSTFPHSIILVRGMKNSRVYWVGDPIIIVGDGVRDWLRDYPMVTPIRYLELLDVYESLGIDPKRIELCRRYLLYYIGAKLVFTSIKYGGNFRHYVDYNKVISKYIRYKEFWFSFPHTVIALVIKKIFKCNKNIKFPFF